MLRLPCTQWNLWANPFGHALESNRNTSVPLAVQRKILCSRVAQENFSATFSFSNHPTLHVNPRVLIISLSPTGRLQHLHPRMGAFRFYFPRLPLSNSTPAGDIMKTTVLCPTQSLMRRISWNLHPALGSLPLTRKHYTLTHARQAYLQGLAHAKG